MSHLLLADTVVDSTSAEECLRFRLNMLHCSPGKPADTAWIEVALEPRARWIGFDNANNATSGEVGAIVDDGSGEVSWTLVVLLAREFLFPRPERRRHY